MSNLDQQQPDNRNPNRSLLYNIFAHDYAEKALIARMAMAKGFGLQPDCTMPFPALPSSNNTIQMTQSGPGKLATAAMATALIGAAIMGGGGLGLGAMAMMKAFTPAAAVVAPTPTPTPIPCPTPAADHGLDIEIPWQFKDGAIKIGDHKITPRDH